MCQHAVNEGGRRTRRGALQFSAAVCLLGATAGCQLVQAPETMNQQSQPRFQSVQLIYRIEGTATAAGVYPGAAAAAPRGGRIQTLSLQYPHPKGRAGYARAELVVERPTGSYAADGASPGAAVNPPANSNWIGSVGRTLRDNLPGIRFRDGVDEALALDIPLGVLEKAVASLEQQGYFDAAAPSASTVAIAAAINGSAQCKPWRTVQELDGILSRVRHEGLVVSHTGPPAAPLAMSGPPPALGQVAPAGWAALGNQPPAASGGDPAAGAQLIAVQRLPATD